MYTDIINKINNDQICEVYKSLPGTVDEISSETNIKKERIKCIIEYLIKHNHIYKKEQSRGNVYYPKMF